MTANTVGGGETLVVVTDANVLINLVHADLIWILERLPSNRFAAPPEVIAEITRPDQQTAVQSAVDAGGLTVIEVSGVDGLAAFAELTAVMGRGEAARLALADSEGWLLASDEKKRFRREALRRLGADRILTTPDLLVQAIHSGLITVECADEARATLEAKKFRMPFGSFRDMLEKG